MAADRRSSQDTHTIWSNGAPSWELAGFSDVAMDPINVVTVR